MARFVPVALASLILASCTPDRPARGADRTPTGALAAAGGVSAPPGAPAAWVAAWTEAGLLTGPCAGEVRSTLVAWDATARGIEAPPGPGGERMLRIPTRERGVWIVVEWPGSEPPRGTTRRSDVGSGADAPLLHRVDAAGTRSRRFTAGCRAAESTTSAGEPGAATFTDADLRAALDEAEATGVVLYAWSPHMPLSVDGWRELASAARMRGLNAIPLLIAHADTAFARREAVRAGIPAAGLREIASVELLMRDVQVHAPSILVLRSGRTSPVLPGYRNAEGYGRFLDAFLGGG